MFSKSTVVLSSVLAAFMLLLFVSCSKDKSTEPPAQVPTLTTADITEITQTTAVCGGTVTSDGGASVHFRGVCWSTNPTPTYSDIKTYDGTGTGTFTSSLTGLTVGTLYYVRAYAMNDAGLGYGNVESFITTDSMGTVTDIDGSAYATIKIGTQWWMAENLKATHYRNSDPIPNVTDSAAWAGLSTGAYCEYDNDIANVATYGRLYNFYVIGDISQLTPAGWHVPSAGEWQTLIVYLGGTQVAGGIMKEAGTTHWSSPNTGATNGSGFSALPAGARDMGGTFDYLGDYAYYWSAPAFAPNASWAYYLAYSGAWIINTSYRLPAGLSIRCVKD